MNKISFVLSLCLGLSICLRASADVYTCSDISSRGFDGRTGEYEPAEFPAIKFKLEVDRENKILTEKIKGETLIDSVTTGYPCEIPYSQAASNLWQCGSDFKQISFNADNGNYVRTSTFGFVSDKGRDPLVIAFGVCDRL